LRKELIRLVEQEGASVYGASRTLGIKNCTGKVIMRQFRKSGHVFVRKAEA
jgi:transposase-like protein